MAEYTIDKIEYGGNVYKLQDNISGYITGTIPTKTSDLTNDSGFITASHTSTYSLPTAVYNTLGGVQPAYSTTGIATLTTSSQTYTNSPTIAARTTTSGKYYGVEIDSDGRLFVNVPWTDKQVTTAALTSGTTYYPILATGTGTATRQIDSTLNGLTYKSTAGTASVVGSAILTLGNNTGSGTANNEQGILHIYGENTYYTTLKANVSGGTKVISLPNKNGTLATTDDITDKKLQVDSLTSGTTYYPILATGTGTATRQIDSTLQSFTYTATAGTTSTNGTSALELGNSIASGTANNQQGGLILYSTTRFPTAIKAGTLTSGRTLTLPDKTGTVALTDDLLDLNIGIDESTQLEFSSGFLVMPETLAEALTQIDDGFLDIWQVATTSRMGMMSNTDKIYLDGLSDAIETTSSTITIKNGSSGGRAFYLETSSSDSDDTSLISAITSLGWDSDVIVS